MFLKKTLLIFLAVLLGYSCLYAQEVEARIEKAFQEEQLKNLSLYQFVWQEMTAYYQRTDFADPSRSTGWYRVDDFLKWVEKNQTDLNNTSILWNEKRVLLKDLFSNLQDEEYNALFWGYLGAKYISDEWGTDLSKVYFFTCYKSVCSKPDGRKITIGFHSTNKIPVQMINIGIHEGAHSRKQYEIPEFVACAAQNTWGLPVKKTPQSDSAFLGVRDFRVSQERLGEQYRTLTAEYNECVILPFVKEWASLMSGHSKVELFCDVLKTAFPRPACQDCRFTQKDFLLLQKAFPDLQEKYQEQAKNVELVHAGFYTAQDILRFFTLYYQDREDALSEKEKENWESLKNTLPSSDKKYSLYFYTVQGELQALISQSNLPSKIVKNILPLGTYAIPRTDRLKKMESFYQKVLARYAEKNFNCTAILPDVVLLLDEMAGPESRSVVPDGYI